jgi:hypothetical protein
MNEHLSEMSLYANVFTYCGGAVSLVFGLVYLFKPSFLNYHSAAIQRDWVDLDRRMQTLIMALMRVVSGGALTVGFVIIVLQYQFNKVSQPWMPITILGCGGILTCTSIYAMLLVRIKTKGRPPILAVILSISLLIIGYYFNRSLLG